MVVFGHLSGLACEIPSSLLTGRNLTVRGFSLRPAEAREDPEMRAALYDRLRRVLETTDAQTPVGKTYALEKLGEALEASERDGTRRVLIALDG